LDITALRPCNERRSTHIGARVVVKLQQDATHRPLLIEIKSHFYISQVTGSHLWFMTS